MFDFPASSQSLQDDSGRTPSQVPALGLITLNGLEEGLEIAHSKSFVVGTLDDLDEKGGTVLHRLGENLQQIPLLIKVHQDVQVLDLVDVLLDLYRGAGKTLTQIIIVGLGYAQEFQATRLHKGRKCNNHRCQVCIISTFPLRTGKRAGKQSNPECRHGVQDVVGPQGNVLDTGPPVVLHEFLHDRPTPNIRTHRMEKKGVKTKRTQNTATTQDKRAHTKSLKAAPEKILGGRGGQNDLNLALPLALGRLIDGHLDILFSIRHHHGTQGRELGVHLLLIHTPKAVEAQLFRVPALERSRGDHMPPHSAPQAEELHPSPSQERASWAGSPFLHIQHLAPVLVAHNVVNELQFCVCKCLGHWILLLHSLEVWQEKAVEILVLHKCVPSVSVLRVNCVQGD